MDVFISFPLLMVIDLVNLNRIEEAKAMLGEALKLDPKFTQAKWRDIVVLQRHVDRRPRGRRPRQGRAAGEVAETGGIVHFLEWPLLAVHRGMPADVVVW